MDKKNRIIDSLRSMRLPEGGALGARLRSMDQRVLFAIAAGVLLVVFLLGTGLYMKHQKGLVPENNVEMMDAERSQVYVTGTGYQIDQQLKSEDSELQDGQDAGMGESDMADSQVDEDPDMDTDSSSDTPTTTTPNYTPYTPSYRPSYTPSYRPSYTPSYTPSKKKDKSEDKKKDSESEDDDEDSPDKDQSEETDPSDDTVNKQPVVESSIENGQTVTTSPFDFWITATDANENAITADSEEGGEVSVTCNGKTLKPKETEEGKINYQAKLAEGKNTFVISVSDKEGYSTALSRWISYEPEAEPEKVGTADVAFDAPVIDPDKPLFESEEFEVKEGDTAEEVLETILKEAGYKVKFKDGEPVSIKGDGISAGDMSSISEETAAKLAELGRTPTSPNKAGTLQNGDFYDSSGWIYTVTVDGKPLKKDQELSGKVAFRLVFALDMENEILS